MDSRPEFFASLLRAGGDSLDRRGFLRSIPYHFFACMVVGILSAIFMPQVFWANERWGAAITVHAGFLAFDGLLLALGWVAFSKIYEILNTGWFSAFLIRNNLLLDHLFFVDLAQVALITSAGTSGIGLVTVLFDFSAIIHKIIFGFCLTFSCYVLIKALSAMRTMNDLVWEIAQNNPEKNRQVHNINDGIRRQYTKIANINLLNCLNSLYFLPLTHSASGRPGSGV